jgi:hypothetical protein
VPAWMWQAKRERDMEEARNQFRLEQITEETTKEMVMADLLRKRREQEAKEQADRDRKFQPKVRPLSLDQ